MRKHLIGVPLLGFFIASGAASAQVVRWDFEEETTDWIVSENDPGTTAVTVAEVPAAGGKHALALSGKLPESIGTTYFPWRDWRPYGTLEVALFVPEGAPEDLDVYLYLKDKQYLWYQTAPFRAADTGEPAIDIKQGRWNQISVDISKKSQVWKPGGHLKSWHRTLYYPREFGIRVFSESEWEGTLLIDDLRLVPANEPPRPPYDAGGPTLKLSRNADSVPCYEKLELTFYFDHEYDNPFDPDEVDVTGHFRTPSGQRIDVPGFFYQEYERALNEKGNEKLIPVGEPCWKVRFSAIEPGEHRYFVSLTDECGELRSATGSFEAKPPADPRGLVRVSKTDPRYFEFDNGEFFFPQGINMRDGGNRGDRQKGTYAFDEFFPSFNEAGLSFVRTWMCAWWAGIEWSDKYDSRYDNLGRYCMYNAWRLDHALDVAEKNDLFIELTFNSHGQLRRDKFDAEWEYNPYAAANGGPCATPSVFWTNPLAKEFFRRRYRYIVARWGYSQHIMSWDLWNEIDLIDGYGQLGSDVAAWHQEMSAYLRDLDPWDHLITTHFCLHFSWDGGKSLWTVPNIDYIQADAYWPTKHIADDMSRGYGLRADIDKPYMVIEYGPQTAGIGNLTRAQVEAFFRIGLWGSAVTPMASPAQFWYNEIWRERNYAKHNAALAKFLVGEDRRGQGWTWINHDQKKNPAAPKTAPASLFVQAMKSPNAAYFYVFDLERVNMGDAARRLNPYQGASVDLQGIVDGQYDAEFWDPYTGEIVANAQLTVADGLAHVVLPDFTQDVACKMRLRG